MLPIIHLYTVFFHCFPPHCKLFFVTYLMLIASITSLKDTITFVFFQFPSNFSVLEDLTKIIQAVVNSLTNSLCNLGFLSGLPMCAEHIRNERLP